VTVGANEEEEETRGELVDRTKIDSRRVPAEHNHWIIHQSNQTISRVGQGYAVANTGAVERLPLM
jgi:hypothetical protein